jgi:hypothetical protein
LEYENTIVLDEEVKAVAIRTLADLLLEAAVGAAKEGTSNEPKDQA